MSASKATRAAHGAMVAGFAAGLNAANLLFFEVVDEFGDHRFFHAKLFLTGMRDARVDAGEPGRMS